MERSLNAMQSYLFVALILGVFLSSWAAPAINQNTATQLKDQMKNMQFHMSTLSDQFESILQNINNHKKPNFLAGNDKRGLEISSEAEEKKKKKELRDELKEISKKLNSVHKQVHALHEKITNLKEELGEYDDDDDDDDDDDFDLDRREIKSSEDSAESPECIKRAIVEENDPFVLQIALTITRQISAQKSREYIERLVNRTVDYMVAKINATHGIKEFRRRLLRTVLELLKVRSILTIKTEGQFIDELDERARRTLDVADKDVNQAKVIKALEEILKEPLVLGFVSKGQEKMMIDGAMKILGKAFRLSKNKTELVANKMIKQIEEDVKKNNDMTKYGKQKGKNVDDNERIKGLQRKVSEKANKNNLNTNETKFLVKGVVGAVAARNKLSEKKINAIENKILNGVKTIFGKMKQTEKNKNLSETKEIKQFIKNHKDIPSGFKEAYASKYAKYSNKPKRNEIESDDTEEKRNILKKLEEITAQLGSKALPHSLPTSKEDLGDKGDQVIIDAATNTRGATRIVEHHNGKRNEIKMAKPAATEKPNPIKNLQKLLKELEDIISHYRSKIPTYQSHASTYKKKNHEKVLIEAAKGTLGERKIVEGYKRKRGLAELVGDAIALIKSLKEKQDRSKLRTEPAQTTTAIPSTQQVTTKIVTEKMTEETITEKATTKPATTEKTAIEKLTTKSPVAEEVGEKSKKSEISDTMKAEVKEAEAKIQKELKDLIKEDESMLSLKEETRKEKEQQRKEKEREEKQKQEEKEREEKEKQKEREQNEKEKEQQRKESEREKAESEKDEEVSTDEKSKTAKVGESAQIEADEKEIENELDAEASEKSSFLDQLKSSLHKENKKPEPKKDDNDLIKELDQLFASS